VTTIRSANTEAFVSYSHDSRALIIKVASLVRRLRSDGVSCRVDQDHSAPPEGWEKWSRRAVADCDFTLIICTEGTVRAYEPRATPVRSRRGARWEAHLICNELYRTGGVNERFIPVIFSYADRRYIPPVFGWVQTHYNVASKEGYEDLLTRLKARRSARRRVPPLTFEASQWRSEPAWLMPKERNRFFSGRTADLKNVLNAIRSDAIVGIVGLGGVGKTQLATEFVYRRRGEYAAVFWISAQSDTEIRLGYEAVARVLGLPISADNVWGSDRDEVVRACLRWFASNQDWLLILDNADNPALLRRFLPDNSFGHVIVTSRVHSLDQIGIARPVELLEWNTVAAVEFLRRRLEAVHEPRFKISAAKLAEELGCLPLALEQAAAYISRTRMSLDEYLKAYRAEDLSLLRRAPLNAESYPTSVATTWLLNFNQVRVQSPAAADLISAIGFLSAHPIPVEVIASAAAELGPHLATIEPTVMSLRAREVVGVLGDLSLVRVDSRTGAFNMHKLVQAVARDALLPRERRLWAERVVRALARVFPALTYDDRSGLELCDQLASHAAEAVAHVRRYRFSFQEAGQLLSRFGVYRLERGEIRAGAVLCARGVSLVARAACNDGIALADALMNAGDAYRAAGQYNLAERAYRRTAKLRERLVGRRHPALALVLNHLGMLRIARGEYGKARPLIEKALRIRQRLPSQRVYALGSMNDLGFVHYAEGRFASAATLHRKVLAGRRRLLGRDHQYVARSLNNLALAHEALGRLALAERCHKAALDIRMKALGEQHPEVAASWNVLGALWRRRGNYVQAQDALEEALRIRSATLGTRHADTATTLHHLGLLFVDMRRYSDGERFLKRALAIRKRALGLSHPYLAYSYSGLGNLYSATGRKKEAYHMFTLALRIRRKAFSARHPLVVAAKDDLRSIGDAERQPHHQRVGR
jgi:tetratricopeptide (TPR) repeat protein